MARKAELRTRLHHRDQAGHIDVGGHLGRAKEPQERGAGKEGPDQERQDHHDEHSRPKFLARTSMPEAADGDP